MSYTRLRELGNKLYFRIGDVARFLEIKIPSARVLCSRYQKKGLILRLKKDFYILREKWDNLSLEEFFKISNFLQVPSYISLMNALSYYEITTQMQKDFFESASLRRSKRLSLDGVIFNYYKLKREYYFGFQKTKEIFIALPEKAFLDSIYLYSLGKYKFDLSSLDLSKLNLNKLKEMLATYPFNIKKAIKKICGI
jgi:predicted transcriptional regulator of viral defense system